MTITSRSPASSAPGPAKPGRISGAVAAALPALVFVGCDVVGSLRIGLVAAGVAALAIVGWRAARRQSLKQPIAGAVVVAVGAAVVLLTGEARGFFLLPAIFPFVVTAVCVATLVARRPLTGLILNRICGGPPDWHLHHELRRVYARTTLACAVVDAVNAAIQLVFYARSDTLVLAVAHVATGPVFAAIVAVTITGARRAVGRTHERTDSPARAG